MARALPGAEEGEPAVPLELTTTIRRVSTSPKARVSLAPAAAAGRAVANLRYITRSTAAEAIEWSGARLDAAAPDGRRAVQAALIGAIEERATQGGQQGRRVADRLIVSLPNDWPPEARREALRRVCAHLAPPGSEAVALGALHSDNPANQHMHILAVDGLESPESAKARAAARRKTRHTAADAEASATGQHPNMPKTRARRRDALRLNEGGRPKELRREIAAILNTIAQEQDLHGVEWRSFEARGITHTPTIHDGPEKRARTRRQAEERPPIDYTPPRPKVPFLGLALRPKQAIQHPPMDEAPPPPPAPVPKPSLAFNPGERPPSIEATGWTPKVRDPDARAAKMAEAKARLARPAPPPPAEAKPRRVMKGGRWITLPPKRPDDEER
jgi:hypothetical protein